MKLRLNLSLRRCLLAALASFVTLYSANTAEAGTLHSQVSMQTYTDFGQNMGRYVTGGHVNALLASIRENEGITITYKEGHDPYRLVADTMISFDGQTDDGAFTAVGYNFLATVQHNGTPNPTFTSGVLPANNSVRYTGIEYRSTDRFINSPDTDYKITRLSKLITDAETSAVYTGDVPRGTLLYRAGAGNMTMRDLDGTVSGLMGAYQYITGGIAATDGMSTLGNTGDSRGLTVHFDYRADGISDTNPLPFNGDGGDSGSPMWIWNEETHAYEYLMAVQAVNTTGGYGVNTYSKGAPQWTVDTMNSYNKEVAMNGDTNTVYVGAVNQNGGTETDSSGRVAELWSGAVTNANGEELTNFQGVKSGINTWLSLTTEIGKDNWYAYGAAFLNAEDAVSDKKQLSKATLFGTQNLVFRADSAVNNVVIDDLGVDLGVGYAQFSRGDAAGENVRFNVSGGLFNHAGYVVDKGVDVHLTAPNTDAAYVREWRKVGEGDLYIEGMGNNEVLLNVGGKGSVYLNEQDGYAAYNVLANTGARVVLQGSTNQIARDFTFGNGGAQLDFNGNSMTWNNGQTDVSAAGFTIHALTEEAVITNTSADDVTLTITNAGASYLGSFRDREGAGALNIVYRGTEKWTLNSISTNLNNSGKSSFSVQQGTVELAGTNTIHAKGSIDGHSAKRLVNTEDWHYADSAMNVNVQDDARFILGSHARLTGDVAVNGAGTFTMREGVTHTLEYVEGGQALEETAQYAAFYGLHGNVTLHDTQSVFEVIYSEGTDADTSLTGSISGEGSMRVNAAKGTLTLSGDNSGLNGVKELFMGGLIAKGMNAVGNVDSHKWLVYDFAWMTVEGTTGENILKSIDRRSTGVLALSENQDSLLELTDHQNLIIGAEKGKTVTYGTDDQTLAANDAHQWLLGGGGGELVVQAQLNDESSTLVLGNAFTEGVVTLTNTGNRIGAIEFMGLVTLNYEDVAQLGDAQIHLTYSNRVLGKDGLLNLLPNDSAGTMLLDKLTTTDLNLGEHESLYLGAAQDTTYEGTITTADDTYRLGGSTGTLRLTQALTGERNLSVDGQHYTGGVIELLTKADLTGTVTVMGYHPDYSGEENGGESGDATLRLSADDAIATAASVTLKNGGILDVNGHDQVLNNLSAEEGGQLTDSSDATGHRVTLNYTEETAFNGSIELDAFTKTGSGTLNLAGSGNTYNEFSIAEGMVCIQGDSVLSATGVTSVQEKAILDARSAAFSTNLHLHDQSTVFVSGHSIGGQVHVEDGSATIHNGVEAATTVSATVDVAENASLLLRGSSFTLTNASINNKAGAGTISVLAKQLNINNQAEANMGGTLSFDSAGDQTLYSARSGNNSLRHINHLHIGGESPKTLTIQEASWNTIWNIHELTGTGTLKWDSKTTHWYSSRLILDGANSFSGTILAHRNSTASVVRPYESYLELAHNLAAQNAHVQLSGSTATKNGALCSYYMSLAVNTDNAHMLSLTGNEQTLLYAGEAVAGRGKLNGENDTTSGGMDVEPTSTRQASVTITGNTNADFKGNIYGGEEGTDNGISLVMNGTASQSFTGSHVALQDITAQTGSLVISSADFSLAGDATLYRGADLRVNDALALQSGHLFTVTGSGAEAATLNSVLNLQGGTLVFDSNTLNTDSFALNLTAGLTHEEPLQSQTISFTNTGALLCNTEYKLASEQGSSLGSLSYTATGMDYLTATFTHREGDGLYVRFGETDGYAVWNGTAEAHVWSNSVFGNNGTQPGADTTVVFNDTATERDVLLQGSITAGTLLFDNAQDYNMGAAVSDATLEVNSVMQRGAGHTTLNKGVLVAADGHVALENGKLTVTDSTVLAQAATVSGAGTLEMKLTDAESQAVLGSTEGLKRLEVNRGTLSTDAALGVAELSIGQEGKLLSTTAAPVAEGVTMALAGTLELQLNAAATLNTKMTAGEDGLKGTLVKSGSGTLNLGAEIEAATLDVQGGRFNSGNGAALNYLLAHVDTLRAGTGATISLGGNAFTISGDNYSNHLAADGGTLEVAIGQHATKTFTGDLSLTNGGTLRKADGGLRFTGNILLGASAKDEVTLLGNWGKDGIILDGAVSGEGTVQISNGGQGAPQKVTLNNNENTFSGTYQVNSGTQLVLQGSHSAADAVIKLNSGSLMLNTPYAVTQGLEGSGSVFFNATEENAGATIDWRGNGHVFNGSIGTGINLHMQSGDQTLAGNSTSFSGSMTMEGGRLTLKDSGLFNNAESITVGESATLLLDGQMNISASPVQNEGLVIFGSNARYTVADITTPATYTLVSGGGRTEGLTLSNFLYNGQSLLGYDAGVKLVTAGDSVLLSISESPDSRIITWNGTGESGVWDDGLTPAWTYENAATESYRRTDSVVFGAEGCKTVTIAAGTATNAMTVQAGDYNFTGMAGLTVNGALRVEKGASATFDTLPAKHTAHLTADGAVTAGATVINRGTATFNDSAHFTNGLTIDGGTAEFNGAVTVDKTGNQYDMVINRGSVSINNKMIVEGDVQLGNDSAGIAAANICIGEQGELTVGKLNSAWGFKTLTVDGVLNTDHFNLSSGSMQTITGRGTINADRLTGTNSGTYNFSNLRLNIGNGGMDGSRTLSFTNMTLGALDNWTTNRAIDLAGDIVIDTAKVGSESGEGATVTLSGLNTAELNSLTKTGAGTLVLNSSNSNAAQFIVAEGTLKVGSGAKRALGSTSGERIRVDSGATLDINGTEGDTAGYTVTLAGGTLTNTGATVGSSQRQIVTGLKLTADSAINAESDHDFGLIASGWGPTAIDLGDHTLEKTGAGTYYITNAAITGNGNLKVSKGTLQFDPKENGHLDSGIEMAGGTLAGTVKLGDDIAMDITKESTISAGFRTAGHTLTVNNNAVASTMSGALTGEGKLIKTGAQDLTLTNGSSSYTGGAEVQQGTLRLSGSAAGMMDRLSSLSVEKDATLHLSTSGSFSNKNWDASQALGNIELGNGTDNMTVNATAFSALNSKATLILNTKAQYEGNGTGTAPATLENNLVIRGDATRSSVRNVDVFNGDITIDGQVLIATHQSGVNRSLSFNGAIRGAGQSDTLIMGNAEGSSNQQFYVFSETADATDLGKMLIKKSYSNWTSVIALSKKSLAQNVSFDKSSGVGALLFVEADNSIDTLQSAAGDGFMNIAKGASLQVKELVDFGGELHLGGVLNKNLSASGLEVGNSLTNNADYVTIRGNGTGKTAHIAGEIVLGADADSQTAFITGKNGTHIENTLIDLAAGTTLNLTDVTLSASSKLTDDTAYVNVQNVTLEAQVGLNTAAPVTVRTVADKVMLPATSEAPQITMTSNSSVYTIQMTNVENVQLSGSHLTIALSGVSQSTLNQHDWVSIALADGASFGDTEEVIVTYDGHTATGYYEQGADHTTLYVEASALTPEPATATLSLLALAALAARRRRH